MKPDDTPILGSLHRGETLLRLYFQVLAGYFALMAMAWYVGFESIYAHPTPFYALWLPSFSGPLVPGVVLLTMGSLYGMRRGIPPWAGLAAGLALAGWAFAVWLDLRTSSLSAFIYCRQQAGALAWHFPAMAAAVCALLLLKRFLPACPGFTDAAPAVSMRAMLTALTLALLTWACAVAMIRGGTGGISQAFQRGTYEYIGDIGVTRNIGALFSRYTSIQSYLSLHARAAPPGPIALLWAFSYAVGRSPMALSLAVAALGSLAIIPLYLWVREIETPRVAAIACVLYAAVPSIVLFTATCTEIAFMPFLFITLFCFDRAINRNASHYAMAAGLGFGILSILKFTLLGLGGYFVFVGLWKMARPETRRNVFYTAAVMGGAFLLFHGLLWKATGFDIITCFKLAKTHFDLDQYHLDLVTPRFPGFWYRLLNPWTWFYFAGIPVSVLFLKRLWKPHPDTRARFIVFFLTLFLLNLLYLGRGEGERSSLYIFPFLVIPAASLLDEMSTRAKSHVPLLAALAFLLFQTWLTESLFYTYW